jgi:hypothetical protein
MTWRPSAAQIRPPRFLPEPLLAAACGAAGLSILAGPALAAERAKGGLGLIVIASVGEFAGAFTRRRNRRPDPARVACAGLRQAILAELKRPITISSYSEWADVWAASCSSATPPQRCWRNRRPRSKKSRHPATLVRRKVRTSGRNVVNRDHALAERIDPGGEGAVPMR